MPDSVVLARVAGFEFSGIVESVADGVTDLKPGDAVFGASMFGGWVWSAKGMGCVCWLDTVHSSCCVVVGTPRMSLFHGMLRAALGFLFLLRFDFRWSAVASLGDQHVVVSCRRQLFPLPSFLEPQIAAGLPCGSCLGVAGPAQECACLSVL